MPVVLFVLGFVAGGLFILGAVAFALLYPFPFADPNKFVYTPSKRRRIKGFSAFSLIASTAIFFMVPGIRDSGAIVLGIAATYVSLMISPGTFAFLYPKKRQE